MTLKQAIEISLIYGEVPTGKVSQTLLRYYADMAQKEIAVSVSPIIKRFLISKEDSKPEIYRLPKDGARFYRIIRRHSVLPIKYSKMGANELAISDYGQFDVYYSVLPRTIDINTPEDYVFEIDTKCHCAIPFYIAHRIAPDKSVCATCFGEWNKLNDLVIKENAARNKALRSGDYFL